MLCVMIFSYLILHFNASVYFLFSISAIISSTIPDPYFYSSIPSHSEVPNTIQYTHLTSKLKQQTNLSTKSQRYASGQYSLQLSSKYAAPAFDKS